ncbi:anthranilate phosphoribosyltransferase [Aeromicrobium marinum DSM 15272]|uniref:Anthranilate phosphoribosyltransferase n=2 Tax=Aeromicrobium marinum TaxID=219314 RepID=E2SAM7_9ACTN|nr:anthranilate phosphoribosyltransferase [Aeromicrobium marinum DSM 15272]
MRHRTGGLRPSRRPPAGAPCRSGDPRRRGDTGRWARHRSSDQGRDLPRRAGPGDHRSTAGRVVGDVVARRRGGDASDPAAPAGRGGHRPGPRRARRRLTGASMSTTWPDLLSSLVRGDDLDTASTAWAMEQILSGAATDAQIAGFAVALRAKGETLDELQGLVDAMLAAASLLDVPDRVVDIVGTGGDRADTVNISSMSAVVAAGAGVGVVKHGNRSASSTTGSADVLEALGVRLDVPADRIVEVYDRAGITFCFAPVFHPSMRHAGPVRRQLGIATAFNFLGPLTNPASPAALAIGCADLRMAPLMAGVLARRGADALVFRGDDGLDEITTTTTSRGWMVWKGQVHESVLDPRDLGFTLSAPEALRGGDVAHNADVFRRVLAGEPGPVQDAVLLNAGAGIAAHAFGHGDLNARIAAGVEAALTSIESGAAADVLDRWVATTAALAPPV